MGCHKEEEKRFHDRTHHIDARNSEEEGGERGKGTEEETEEDTEWENIPREYFIWKYGKSAKLKTFTTWQARVRFR